MNSKTLYTLAGICIGGIVVSATLAKFLHWENGYALVTLFLLGLMVFGMWGGLKYKNEAHPKLTQAVQSASRYDIHSIPIIIGILVLMYAALSVDPSLTFFKVTVIALAIVLYIGWWKTGRVIFWSARSVVAEARMNPAVGRKQTTVIVLAVVGGLLFWYVVGGGDVALNKMFNVGDSKGESADFVSDWKTYRNERYGFELRYPFDWKDCSQEVEKSYEKSTVQLLCIEQEIPGDRLGLSKIIRLMIDPEKVSAYTTYEKLVQYLKTGHETAQKVGLYSVFKEGTTGRISFVQSGAGDMGTWGNFYIFLKGHVLAVGYNNAPDTVEQILPTFTFTK